MESSEYKRGYPRLAGEKLVIPHNADGSLDLEFYSIAEKLDEKLKHIPGYVGLTSVGSRTRGYAEKDSDFDIVVFYDNSKYDTADGTKDLRTGISASIEILKRTQKVDIDLVALIDLDSYYVHSDFKQLLRSKHDTSTLGAVRLGFLFSQTAIGHGIDEYRSRIARELENVPGTSKSELIRLLAEAVVGVEKAYGNERKAYNRLRVSKKTSSSLRAERLKNWEQQISESVRLYS